VIFKNVKSRISPLIDFDSEDFDSKIPLVLDVKEL
jgi:hypothetical protein